MAGPLGTDSWKRRREQGEVPVVPRVSETVDTCARLSEVLANGLREDIEEDTDSPLREADIE